MSDEEYSAMSPILPTAGRVLTTHQDEELAHQVLNDLTGPEGKLAVERGEKRMDLPPALGRILQQVLETMAAGGTVTVMSTPKELTTSTAAAMLGVSRPTMIKMIEDGRIPAHKVGSHNRLMTDDVQRELHARRARERAAFLALRDEFDEDEA